MRLLFTETTNIKQCVPELIEKTNSRNGIVQYGTDNKYPEYLFELYKNSPIMTSIINTMVDYTVGDSIYINNSTDKIINRKNENISDLVRKLIFDYCLYGGFAFQIIRNGFGDIAELNWVDFRYVRTNEEEDIIYYSNWYNNTRKQPVKYERYNPSSKQPNSILYYKGNLTKGVYPIPFYLGCIKSLEITTQISDYHLSQLLNNFSIGAIINFNNGLISPDEMAEIEESIKEKFQGTNNSGRILLSFNNNSESATTIETFPDNGFDNKYQALKQQVIDDIYMGFRINPVLLGYNTASGFNKQEFSEAFTLFQRTVIQPIQQQLKRVLEQIFDKVEIKPFSIDWGEQHENGNIPIQEQTEENKLINIGE